MMLSPLAADMYDIVSQMGKEHYLLFGPGGAFAKAYGLFNAALALGAIVGPAFAGLLYDREGWNVAVWVMAAFCASGVVPVVRLISPPSLESYGSNEEILIICKCSDPFHGKGKRLLHKVRPRDGRMS